MDTYEETLRVRFKEVNRDGKVKIGAWFDYLQEAAAHHAEELGVGYSSITKNGKIWALERLKITISGDPAPADFLRVETYPTSFRRIFARRQFLVRNMKGEVVARASSNWLFLDAASLRPQRLDEVLRGFPENKDREQPFALDDRPAPLAPDSAQFQSRVVVRASMEDINRHLNNSEYAALTQDLLATQRGEAEIRTLDISWRAAAKRGDELVLYGALSGDKFQVSGYLFDNRLSFIASGELAAR